MNEKQFARQLQLLRRESGMTQEELAERLHVSAQAVSKWENGHSLPEAALLPALARLLDVTIDTLFQDGNLMILEAFFGDGIERVTVARRLSRFTENESLSMLVSPQLLGGGLFEERTAYLTVKYRTKRGICFAAFPEGELLELCAEDEPTQLPAEGIYIIAGRYGTKRHSYDVMHKIRHYEPMRWNAYRANHETFPSDPASDKTDYLTLVYLNRDGIHMATCAEGESLVYADAGTRLTRQKSSGMCLIPDVEELPSFGRGMECSWAAALTTALRVMGHRTSYEEVMGVSGACYRLAFCSPNWDYSSVDGLVAYDFMTPGYAAFGYTSEHFAHIEKADRSAHRQRIMKEIRNGMPVLGINLRVAAEWGVICGYDRDGEELLCRTKYDRETVENDPEFMKDFPPFDPGAIQNPYGYLAVDNWPFLLCYFTGKRQAPTAKENLLQSLRVFLDCGEQERGAGYYMGFGACEIWARDLRDDTFYQEADDMEFTRRFSVNQFCALALMDARRAACAYLQNAAGIPGCEGLLKTAERFTEVYRVSAQIQKMTDSGKELSGNEARAFWTREKRRRQAELLDQLAAFEREARVYAGKFVSEHKK